MLTIEEIPGVFGGFGQAMAVEGLLIPIRLLVNDAGIRQEAETRYVHYFHVELERHDLLLVEGLLAESDVGTGNHGIFASADTSGMLHPNLVKDADGQARRAVMSCLPVGCTPQQVRPVLNDLATRAEAMGF